MSNSGGSFASALTKREKSLLGIGVYPGFQDFFNTIASHSNPDATKWNSVENGTGVVEVKCKTADVPGFLRCDSGNANGDDGIAHTKDLYHFSLKNDVTCIHLEAYVNFNWSSNAGDVVGIGFCRRDTIPADVNDLKTNTHENASIVVHDDVPTAYTTSGAANETTDLSAYISDDTWYLIGINIYSDRVEFLVDGTIIATHSTEVPDDVWHLVLAATCTNNVNEYISAHYVRVWGE